MNFCLFLHTSSNFPRMFFQSKQTKKFFIRSQQGRDSRRSIYSLYKSSTDLLFTPGRTNRVRGRGRVMINRTSRVAVVVVIRNESVGACRNNGGEWKQSRAGVIASRDFVDCILGVTNWAQSLDVTTSNLPL